MAAGKCFAESDGVRLALTNPARGSHNFHRPPDIFFAEASMTIEFYCDCGKKLGVGDEHAGKRVKCPVCLNALTVP